MTQIFDAARNVAPLTVLRTLPCMVLAVKTKEKDGYEAVQIGIGARRQRHIAKAQRGLFGTLGNFRYVKEFRRAQSPVTAVPLPVRGDKIDASQFQEGDIVKVSGISKAKGFQGVMKRHGFHGAPATHGTKHAHREPGSIGGMGRAGGRVAKGMRMAGRMGGERVTVSNLKIMKVDVENSMIAIKGAIPGRRGTLIEICG